MNKFESFRPLMHEWEYKFVEKYLNKDDILFEWGCGNGTLYFSGLVNKLISIEHDYDWYQVIKQTIDAYHADNIEFHYVKSQHVDDQKKYRHIAFKDYIEFPIKNNIKFTKVLVDGRARKHCAISIYDYIDEDVIVFVHDFNFQTSEGYVDEEYQTDILKYYDIYDIETRGQGIVALKKK